MQITNNIVALDLGSRRVGVAIANGVARLPHAHSTLINDETFWDKLHILLDSEDIKQIVIGLPRGLDGQETPQTKLVRTFAAEIAEKTGLPVNFQDEAVTSVLAEENLSQTTKGYTRDMIDAVAAAIILKDYLDSQEEKSRHG